MYESTCLACLTLTGDTIAPGGVIFENDYWMADHCVGAMGIGSIVLKTKAHREHLWELTPDESKTLGSAIQILSDAIVQALGAERVYVNLWVDQPPYHVHFVLQPRYPGDTEWGLRGWKLQLFRLLRGKPIPDRAATAANQIRAYLAQAR